MRFSRTSAIIAILGFVSLPCTEAKVAARAVDRDLAISDDPIDPTRVLQEGSFSLPAEAAAIPYKGKAGKTGGSAKSGKTGGSTKSGKGGGNGIVGRFGPLLTPKQIAKNFIFSNNTQVITEGLQNYGPEGVTFSGPAVDSFDSSGLLLTFEEVISICVTRCHENEMCKVVRINPTFTGIPPNELKPEFICTMFKPSLGPGATKFGTPPFWNGFDLPNPVLYTKKHTSEIEQIPDFEPCNILVPALGENINCTSSCPLGPVPGCECLADLPADFVTYVLPAVQCGFVAGTLAGGDGAEFIGNCLSCTTGDSTVTLGGDDGPYRICTPDSEENFFRGTRDSQCGLACFHNVSGSDQTLEELVPGCPAKLQTAMLCSLSSIPVVAIPNELVFGGSGNNFPYECPAL